MKHRLVDIFYLDGNGLVRRALSVCPPSPRLFCLASPESCYVFGQLPSYLLLHSNCHSRTLLIAQPCSVCHVPSPPGNSLCSIPYAQCNTHIGSPHLTLSPNITCIIIFIFSQHVIGLLSQHLL